MPTAVNRVDLIQKLDAVQPGLSAREITEQSSSFIFRNGRVYTYNEDVACRIRSGLPKTFEGAVIAKPLQEALGKMKSVMVDVTATDNRLVIKDKRGGTTRVLLDAKIKLPIDEVEKPVADGWRPISPDFGQAVGLVQECASKDESQNALTCVHLHPNWVEACDLLQMSRYRIKTGLKKPIMVKRDSLKHVIAMDMTDFNESEKWIHFKNPGGLVLSCLRYVDPYPHDQITALFKGFEGTRCDLPKGLDLLTELAHIFSKEDPDDDQITVELMPGRMKVTGAGNSGDHTGFRKCGYDGPRLEFKIGPKLLAEITKKHTEATFSREHLVVEAKRWQYLTALTAPGKKAEPEVVTEDGEDA